MAYTRPWSARVKTEGQDWDTLTCTWLGTPEFIGVCVSILFHVAMSASGPRGSRGRPSRDPGRVSMVRIASEGIWGSQYLELTPFDWMPKKKNQHTKQQESKKGYQGMQRGYHKGVPRTVFQGDQQANARLKF